MILTFKSVTSNSLVANCNAACFATLVTLQSFPSPTESCTLHEHVAVVYKLSAGNYNLKVITPESRTRQLFHLHGRRDIKTNTRKHLDVVAISPKNTPKMLNASALLACWSVIHSQNDKTKRHQYNGCQF